MREAALLLLVTLPVCGCTSDSPTTTADTTGSEQGAPFVAAEAPPESVPTARIWVDEGNPTVLPLAFSEWIDDGEVVTEEPSAASLEQANGAVPLDPEGEMVLAIDSSSRPEYLEVRFFLNDPRAEGSSELGPEPVGTTTCHHPAVSNDDPACVSFMGDAVSGSRRMQLRVPDETSFLTVFATWPVFSDADDEPALLNSVSAAWFGALEA